MFMGMMMPLFMGMMMPLFMGMMLSFSRVHGRGQ